MADLVYRQPCKHGETVRHRWRDKHGWLGCPGGSEVVLDPDKVLHVWPGRDQEGPYVLVADVLDALEGES
jgi:hypothetical protein